MQENNYYQVGGSLKANHPTYIYRRADRELLKNLKDKEYCYVFNSRQMGKSSLRIQTIKKLRKEGIKCASLDLSAIGTSVEPTKWYYSVCFELLSSLDLEDEIDFTTWWSQHKHNTEVQKLELFIDNILLAQFSQDLVIFFDEIDSTIKLDFKDDFFAFLRACYNKRAENKKYDRLTVCLLGVATPADLIQDKDRTPFNISRAIELTGFTLEEAKSALTPGFSARFSHPEDILKKVLSWTGGQPFLTQKLCQIILQKTTNKYPNITELVEQYIIENWEEKDEPEHLRTLCDRLLRNENKAIKLLELYQNILKTTILSNISEIVLDNSIEQTELRLSGIAVKRDGYLQVYNPIYQAVFNLNWVKQQLDNLRPYAAAFNNWLSSQKDPSFLLRDKELNEALSWSKNKRIGDGDREFLTASQQFIIEKAKLEQEAQKKANFILEEANQKANRVIAFGGILAGFLICGSILGSYLNIREARRTVKEVETFQIILQESYNASQQFQSRQLDALLTAIEAGQELKLLRKNKHSKPDYQTLNSLFTLQNILANIREYNQLESPERSPFNSVTFSPDGKIIASADNNGIVKIWQKNGTLITSFQAHNGKITALSFSSDGNTIASVSEERTVKLWQKDGTLIVKLPKSSEPLIGISFSRNGNILVTASKHGTISIWQKDGTLINSFTDKSRGINSIAFSPDSNIIAVGTSNGAIELRQLNGKLIKTISAHLDGVTSLSFSPDGQKIVSGSYDRTIKIWRKDGTLIQEISGHTGSITKVNFSPDGKTIASASIDRTVKIWREDGTILATLRGHLDTVNSLTFSPDGNTLASASDDGTIKLWRLDRNLDRGDRQDKQVKAMDFSRDGKIALIISNSNRITLKKLNGSQIDNFQIDPNFFVTSVAVDRDGKTIALGDDRTRVQLYRQDGKLINTWSGSGSIITSINFSPNGRIMAIGNDLGEIELRDKSGNLINTLSSHQGWVKTFAFSPDGQIMASGSDDGTIKLWQKDGTLIKTLKNHTKGIKSLHFSPDGKLLVSASSDLTLKLWNEKGDLIDTLTGHDRAINSVIFSPDGETIVSGSDDGTIKSWQKDGTPINSLNTGDRAIISLRFSSDGKTLAFASPDGNVTLLSFQIDALLTQGCQWLKDYFQTHPSQLQKFNVCQ